jgi:hypothetical protein
VTLQTEALRQLAQTKDQLSHQQTLVASQCAMAVVATSHAANIRDDVMTIQDDVDWLSVEALKNGNHVIIVSLVVCVICNSTYVFHELYEM